MNKSKRQGGDFIERDKDDRAFKKADNFNENIQIDFI